MKSIIFIKESSSGKINYLWRLNYTLIKWLIQSREDFSLQSLHDFATHLIAEAEVKPAAELPETLGWGFMASFRYRPNNEINGAQIL